MKIQIVGMGVVGTAQAHLISHLGHDVLGVDRNKTTSEIARMAKEAEPDADLTFICTQEAFVEDVVTDLVRKKVKGPYVIKSTVPSGTTRRIGDKFGIHICHNPEFLRENSALNDVIHPHVVVIGQCCAEHGNLLKKLYSPVGCPIMITQPTVSETVKLTLNSYLATLISYWNEVDKIAKALGISTAEVAQIVKQNPRVSSYGTEFFGAPFGGKCLPKDLNQLIAVGLSAGVEPKLLEAIRDFNGTIKNADSV
jgi:nucleotide sugar dehydrogenase